MSNRSTRNRDRHRRNIQRIASPGGGKGFIPSQVAGLQLWLKADVGLMKTGAVPATADGDAIAQWKDQSGNNHHASQATGANQPLLKLAILNGLPVVRFDGITTSMLTANLAPQFTTAGTLIVVFAVRNGDNDYAVVNTGGASRWCFTGGDGFLGEMHAFQSGYPTGAPTSGVHVWSILSSATVYELFRNKVSAGAAPAGFVVPGVISVGVCQAITNFFDGDIAEILLFDGALAPAARAAIENYLFNKWGLNPPTVTSITVNAAGNLVTINLSAPITGHTGFNLDTSAAAITLTYASGDPGTALSFTPSRTIVGTEVLNLDYTPGDVATATKPLAAFTNAPVTNNAAPRPVSAAVDVTGFNFSIVFNEPVTGHTGLHPNSNEFPLSITYASGEGTNTLTFTTDRGVIGTETLTVDYAAGDIVSAGSGAPLANFTGMAVTNGTSVFSPPSISGLQLWLAADAGTFQTSGGAAAVANNDPIGEWQDQSGLGNHVSQAASGVRPLLALGAANGRPAIRFDGVDDFLATTVAVAAFPAKRGTLFFVTKHTTTVTNIVNGGVSGGIRWYAYSPCGLPAYRWYDNATNFAGADIEAPNNWSMHSYIRDTDTNLLSYADGILQDTFTIANNQPLPAIVGIGGNGVGGGGQINGDIAEVILYDRALTPTEHTQVVDYLRLRYFSPAGVPGLAARFSADAGTFQTTVINTAAPAVADADPVGLWLDQSANGGHVIQATAGKRPLLKLAVQNGRSVLRFDGVDDFLANLTAPNAQPRTVFLVLVQADASYRQVFFTGGDTYQGIYTDTGPIVYSAYAGANLGSAVVATTAPVLLTVVFNGATSVLRVNGVTVATGNVGTIVPTGYTIGAIQNGTSDWTNGDFCEVLSYDAVLSDARRDAIEAYLTNRWMFSSPASVPGLAAWYKADAGTVQTTGGAAAAADADPVGEWQDQSGNGRHLLQATAGKRPLLKLAIQAGKPVIRFDGVDDLLQKAFTLNFPSAVFICYRIRTMQDPACDLDGAPGGTAALREYAPGTIVSLVTTFGYEGALTMSGADDAAFHVVSCLFSPGAALSGLQRDATVFTPTGASGVGTGANGVTLGGFASDVGWSAIDVAELCIYSTPPSLADADAIRAYLKARWGTP